MRFTRSPADVERADLVVVPGTKATVEDLERLRDARPGPRAARRAAAGDPILGVCGGYQLLGERDRRRRRVPAPARSPASGCSRSHAASRPTRSCARVTGHARCSAAPSPATRSATAAPARPRRRAAHRRRTTAARAARSARRSARPGTACSSTTTPAARCCAGWPAHAAGASCPRTAALRRGASASLDRLGDLVEEHLDTGGASGAHRGRRPGGAAGRRARARPPGAVSAGPTSPTALSLRCW